MSTTSTTSSVMTQVPAMGVAGPSEWGGGDAGVERPEQSDHSLVGFLPFELLTIIASFLVGSDSKLADILAFMHTCIDLRHVVLCDVTLVMAMMDHVSSPHKVFVCEMLHDCPVTNILPAVERELVNRGHSYVFLYQQLVQEIEHAPHEPEDSIWILGDGFALGCRPPRRTSAFQLFSDPAVQVACVYRFLMQCAVVHNHRRVFSALVREFVHTVGNSLSHTVFDMTQLLNTFVEHDAVWALGELLDMQDVWWQHLHDINESQPFPVALSFDIQDLRLRFRPVGPTVKTKSPEMVEMVNNMFVGSRSRYHRLSMNHIWGIIEPYLAYMGTKMSAAKTREFFRRKHLDGWHDEDRILHKIYDNCDASDHRILNALARIDPPCALAAHLRHDLYSEHLDGPMLYAMHPPTDPGSPEHQRLVQIYRDTPLLDIFYRADIMDEFLQQRQTPKALLELFDDITSDHDFDPQNITARSTWACTLAIIAHPDRALINLVVERGPMAINDFFDNLDLLDMTISQADQIVAAIGVIGDGIIPTCVRSGTELYQALVRAGYTGVDGVE